MQLAFSCRLAVALQLFGAGFVLPDNLYQGARGETESLCRFFGVAVLLRNPVEYVGDEQGEKGVRGLDMPVAAGKGNFGRWRRFPDSEGEGHLHSAQCMRLIFLRAPAFAGFDF